MFALDWAILDSVDDLDPWLVMTLGAWASCSGLEVNTASWGMVLGALKSLSGKLLSKLSERSPEGLFSEDAKKKCTVDNYVDDDHFN